MKSPHAIIAEPARPSLQEIAAWSLALSQWQQRLAPYFARPEPRQHAWLYRRAIISEMPRKNGWQIAEYARQPRPSGMQRLLSRAVWDEEGVRDELRACVQQTLYPPPLGPGEAEPEALFPVLVMDESGFPKRGRHSAGVQRQYCGATGRVENCQVGVFLSYVTARGHAVIDRELYLPEEWCHDLPRRQAVHLPTHVSFQTKPELARRMVQRAQSAGLPIRWVVADTVYGHCPDLRVFLEEQGYAYALAVPCTEVVCVQTPQGWLLNDVASIGQQALDEQDWHRLSQSLGTKGLRLFDWARLPLVHRGTVDQRHWLVFRRCLDDPTQVAYYLVFTPLAATPLPIIVQAIGARWCIEEDLQATKDLGLDQYEVRSYLGWYRHLTLVLLVYALLVGICVQDQHAHPVQEEPGPASALIAFTASEVRHLLARLIWPAPTCAPLLCQWSWWRRAHQYWAGYYHRRRREKADSA
ncbi:MAG TPA: IS701 family transposase [Ktedonobacteraceae bacterium]